MTKIDINFGGLLLLCFIVWAYLSPSSFGKWIGTIVAAIKVVQQ